MLHLVDRMGCQWTRKAGHCLAIKVYTYEEFLSHLVVFITLGGWRFAAGWHWVTCLCVP